MAQIITTPDNKQHYFPDEATPAQIEEALKTYKPDSLTAPQPGTLAAGTSKGSELTEPIEDPQRLPPAFTQGVASLPTDPNAKVRYLAKSLFPKLSDSAALDRIGFKNGRVIYKADDGKVYYAEPSFDTGHLGRTFMEAPSLAAGQVGPGMTTVGAIGGGVATPEILGGVPGSAGGAAVADMARQGLAAWLTGEKKTFPERLLQTGGEAVVAGGGQLGGNVLFHAGNKLLNLRNPLRVSGYDVSQMTKPRIAAGEAKTNLAQGMGVTVLPGEAMNSRSLLFRQRQLGREQEGATPLQDFYLQRNTEQLPQAWERHVLDPISSVKAPALGARQMQTGAKETIDAAVAARRAASQPAYKAVMRADNILPSADFNQLMANNPMAADALKAVRSDPVLSKSIEGMPDASLPVLDLVKRHLDAMEKGFKADPKGGNHARITGGYRDDFVTALDSAFPGYDAARAAYAGTSPAVDELRKGLVGLVAKDRKGGFQNVPNTLLGSTSADPMSITSARNAYAKAGKLDEWNAGVRSYLDNLFSTAAKQEQGPATNLWKTIQGDRRQLANLKVALAPDQFQALDDFMQVAEMVRRAPAEGSPTVTDIGGRAAFAGRFARGAATLAKGVNPLNIPTMMSNAILDYSSGKNIGQLVDALKQPNAIRALRKLRALPPGTQKWTAAVTNLMTEIGKQKLEQEISGSPDQPLGYLLQTPPAP